MLWRYSLHPEIGCLFFGIELAKANYIMGIDDETKSTS